MNIRFKKKPDYVFTTQNRRDVEYRINYTQFGNRVSIVKSFGGGTYNYHDMRNGDVYAFHFEKRRKQVTVTNKKYKSLDKNKSFHRTVDSRAHWIIKVYIFKKDFLKMADIKIIQHNRHFDIVPAKS